MRRADEEPERPDSPLPLRSRAGGRLLVPLVVAGAAVVVLSTAAEGRAHVTPLGIGAPKQMPPTPGPAPSAAAARPPAEPLGPTVSTAVPTILTVLLAIVALTVAALLIRLLISAIRNRRTRPEGLQADGAESEPEVADAPAVLRGIAAALVAFDGDREPGDAVVQAWLGLQQAAEDAGFARSAAETPTEFTGRVLSRTGADRVALRTLLRLYLRARFGDGAITAADATDARDALRALEASWERVTVSDRG